jgi:hypothetical protein
MSSATISVTVTDADGATASATTTATQQAAGQTETMGQTAVLTEGDNGNGNLLIAQPATLAAQGTLQSLSFYVTTTGSDLVLGVYKDNGGSPGALVAQTAQFTPVKGWNTQPTTTTPTLAAGNYWLCYFPSSNTLGFVKQDGGVPNAFFKTLSFSATLPATYPTAKGFFTASTVWSLYATLATAPSPPLSPTLSTFTISPAEIQIGTPVTLTVTAKDINGNPYPGASVSFASSGAGDSYAATSGTTNASGFFTTLLTPSIVKSETITATITGASVSFNLIEPLSVTAPANGVVAVNLSNTTLNVPNAASGTLIGHVTLTLNPPTYQPSAVTLSGPSGSLFALTNGGVAPCDLVVGSHSIAAGSYAISLSAS